MDKIITERTDDPNYEFFGKLSDGTPIYKYNPPPPPDPKILKEVRERKKQIVSKYNKSVTIDKCDTSEFLTLFKNEEAKESAQKATKQQIAEKRIAIDNKFEEHKPSNSHVLDYFNKPIEEEVKHANEEIPENYLDLFKQEEVDEKAEEERLSNIREQHEAVILEENKKRQASAKKYEDFQQSLKEAELNELRAFEQLVEEREILLKQQYDTILVHEKKIPLFTTPGDLRIKIHKDSNNVTVTNTSNGEHKNFNYIGDLQSADIKEYRLILYSIVKDSKQYGIIKEGYNYTTHRHTVYNLKTSEIISRESYVVSKVDPASISKDDPEIYAEGWTAQNRTLSALGEPYAIYNTPGTHSLDISNITTLMDGVDTIVRPSEIIVECWGAGGAGVSGTEQGSSDWFGAAGSGGSYVRRTIQFGAYQTFPIALRLNIGNGQFSESYNSDTIWNNTSGGAIRNKKDSWLCIDDFIEWDGSSSKTLSTIAGGGYDGSNLLFYDTSVMPGRGTGYPGRPQGLDQDQADYDVGHWGSGYKPWSVMKYQLSGVTTIERWQGATDPGSPEKFEAPDDGTIIYGSTYSGFSHNAATSATHGAGTGNPNLSEGGPNIGLSSGRSGDGSNTAAASGQSPGAGGGTGFGRPANLTIAPYGSAGGNGKVRITLTKGVINRDVYS